MAQINHCKESLHYLKKRTGTKHSGKMRNDNFTDLILIINNSLMRSIGDWKISDLFALRCQH